MIVVWAIERLFGGRPVWLSMSIDYSMWDEDHQCFRHRVWSRDFNAAIQFVRQQDAENAARAILNSRGVGYTVTDHAIG